MTEWQRLCEERIAHGAAHWDHTNRGVRRELAHWRRRLWWAKYGRYISALLGSASGAIVGLLIANAAGWLA